MGFNDRNVRTLLGWGAIVPLALIVWSSGEPVVVLAQDTSVQNQLVQNQLAQRGLGQERLAQEQPDQNELGQGASVVVLAQDTSVQDQLFQNQLAQEEVGQERLAQEELDQNELAQGRVDQGKLGQERLAQEELDQNELAQGRIDQGKLDQEELDQEELDQNELGQEGETPVVTHQNGPVPGSETTPEITPETESSFGDEIATDQAIPLFLPDVILLLLENNYELKNAILQRIVERQQLREAESRFDPQFTPSVGIGISQTLSSTIVAPPSVGGGAEPEILDQGTILNRAAQLQGTLRTPVGTEVEMTVNPFWDQGVNLRITQPLLRGFGLPVNQAPVQQARLGESQNILNLQQTLITQITQTILSYREIIRAQESLRIQYLSLADLQQQRYATQVLIEAGRLARKELVDIEADIARTNANILAQQNNLERTKTALLRQLDLGESLNIEVPESVIESLRQPSPPPNLLPPETLLNLAYAHRPDYYRAQLALEIAQLQEVEAVDDRRWNLNLQTDANWQKDSDVAVSLQLNRLFGEQARDTALVQSRVSQLRGENDLENLTHEIQLDVEDGLRDIESALEQVEATRRARELAEQRLENAKRPELDPSLFEILQRQQDVTTAQNAEVNARIDLENALTQLEQTIGLTLETWQVQVETSGILTSEDQ